MQIDIKNLSFSFGEKKILENISFFVEKGEILVIVGPSGCGKSTLLRIVSGILKNSKDNNLIGTVLIDDLPPIEYIKKGKLSFMFQEPTLLPNLNVFENIEMPLRIRKNVAIEKINNIISIVGLSNFKKFMPQKLSGGMKTRVALARSFVTDPELLLLDEPFSSLDIAWKSKLYIELNKLITKNKTSVVIVTHDVQEALLLADSIIVLSKDGAVKKTVHIKTEYSKSERVLDITNYLNTVYSDYLLPIQDAIIKD